MFKPIRFAQGLTRMLESYETIDLDFNRSSEKKDPTEYARDVAVFADDLGVLLVGAVGNRTLGHYFPIEEE